jgi:cell fate regulator YaaT (PSP1 superfamily)
MPIFPLPQFEADLAQLQEEDLKAYEALKAPKTLVVRFGAMMLVGEFPYDGSVKPGCGSKMVVRTHRGTELGEMLTSTCPNSGCSKSVSRKELLQYVQNSGGRDYPFFQEGRVLRIATTEDLDRQAAIEQSKHALKLEARAVAERLGITAKVIDAEPILGGELLTFHVLSEERLDLRDLHRDLAHHFRCRVDIKQVGARDEARLTADYEKCGQYCCCKNFLKVLKPVSMKSAKVQKATLDPLKISGRCGRLMCCLRYEDATYEELKAKLPRKKSRVGTPEGDGLVIDTQILTQLALVELDEIGSDGKIRQVAIAVEDLTEPVNAKAPVRDLPPPPRGGERADRGTPPTRTQGAAPSSGTPQPTQQPSQQRDPRPARPTPSATPSARPTPQPIDADTTADDLDTTDDGDTPQSASPASPTAPATSAPLPPREFRSARGPNRGQPQSSRGTKPPTAGNAPQGTAPTSRPPSGAAPGPRGMPSRASGPSSGQVGSGGPSAPGGPSGRGPGAKRPPMQRDSVDDLLASLDDADELGRGRPQGPRQGGPAGPNAGGPKRPRPGPPQDRGPRPDRPSGPPQNRPQNRPPSGPRSDGPRPDGGPSPDAPSR